MALAPRRALLSVPSSSPRATSMARCPSASAPRSSSAISPLTNATAVGHALAAVALAAVAQLDGLVLTGRRAARHGGPPGRPARQHDLDLDGRVAAGVEDLPAQDVHDLAHPGDRSRGITREPAGMDLQLTGKRAIVTGGSKGIGKAVARALSAEGCDVVIASRTALDAGGDGPRDQRGDGRSRGADHGRHRRGRVRAGARRRRRPRPSAASTSSSTAPPSRSASRRRRSWPTSRGRRSGTT